MSNQPYQPLCDIAAGRDQEDKTALVAAFRRKMHSHRRPEVTDLHVRELLTYVLAVDIRRDGIQLSYNEVASLLECSPSTARNVVKRAEQVYGLLERTEERYVRGGQSANRYSISWQMVRTINSGQLQHRCLGTVPDLSQVSELDNDAGHRPSIQDNVCILGAVPAVSQMPEIDNDSVHRPSIEDKSCDTSLTRPAATRGHPPDTRQQAADTRGQGPATRGHPFKEQPLFSPSFNPSAAARAPATTEQPVAAAAEVDWSSVDWEGGVIPKANALWRHLSSKGGCGVDRKCVWQACAILEAFTPGGASELVSNVISNANKPRAYIDAALRRECEARGLQLHVLRQEVRDPPPTVQNPEDPLSRSLRRSEIVRRGNREGWTVERFEEECQAAGVEY